MNKFLLLLFLFIFTSSAQAFSVVNNTNYSITIKAEVSSWWNKHKYTIEPHDQHFQINSKIEPNSTANYTITIKNSASDKIFDYGWNIHCSAITQFRFEEASGIVRLFINDQAVA